MVYVQRRSSIESINVKILTMAVMIIEKLFRVCVLLRRAVCAEESLALSGYVAGSARDAERSEA